MDTSLKKVSKRSWERLEKSAESLEAAMEKVVGSEKTKDKPKREQSLLKECHSCTKKMKRLLLELDIPQDQEIYDQVQLTLDVIKQIVFPEKNNVKRKDPWISKSLSRCREMMIELGRTAERMELYRHRLTEVQAEKERLEKSSADSKKKPNCANVEEEWALIGKCLPYLNVCNYLDELIQLDRHTQELIYDAYMDEQGDMLCILAECENGVSKACFAAQMASESLGRETQN